MRLADRDANSRQALKTRKRRQRYLPPEASTASIDSVSGEPIFAKSFSEYSSPSECLTCEYPVNANFKKLRDDVEKLANASSLNFGSGNSVDMFLVLYEVGFSRYEIVDNLKGYTTDDEELEGFVMDLFDVFLKHAPNAEADLSIVANSSKKIYPQASANNKPDHSTLSSPSKASKQSQSEIINLELYEDEEDVGQEILFQLTQEALNELIDPFLKPREDLWLEAQTTKAKRKSYREEICKAVNDPTDIFRGLVSFLKQIQITPDYPPLEPHWAQALRSEAANFSTFLRLSEARVFDTLTSQTCQKCKSKVHIGYFCESCGAASAVAQKMFTYPSTTETCAFCSANGIDRAFKNEFSNCDQCASPSARKARELQWLWEALSGDKARAELEQTQKRKEALERRRLDADWLQSLRKSRSRRTSDGVAPTSSDKQMISNNANETIAISSPSLSAGDGSPSAADSILPATPETGSHDVPVPDIEEHEAHEYDVQRAHVVRTLQSSIDIFDQGDDPQETKISQKSLQELLHETGFEVENGWQNPHGESPVQHPPRSTSLPDTSHSYPASDAHLYIDPTLPQNRPNSAPQVPGCPSNELAKPEPPDWATLRYWAALTILEAEDEQFRGGPGRLSEQEFLDIMLGERGKGLEFVGDWMNMTAF